MEINKIIQGNCLTVLKTLPDNSVDCCITSPPYWGLRDYGHQEQLGSEKHFKEFVNNLCNIFDEIKRVLKDTGTCFVNLGDTYGTKYGNMHANASPQPKNKAITKAISFEQSNVGLHKSLCMVPERFAIEMIDRGWTLRNQIIWHKPNQMPSSATDRFTVDFEKIFFFVKKPMGYYFEQQTEPFVSKPEGLRNKNAENSNNGWHKGDRFSGGERDWYSKGERNLRTLWSVNTETFEGSHFATYPQRLVERMVRAGCPENGTVIDPFFGSGTTGIYARKVNRNFVGIELNPEYIKIANKRLFKELGMFA